MSLRAPLVYCLPEDTARVARAAFPKGNAYLRFFDTLGPIDTNPQFADLFLKAGQPAIAPAQLALATIFQFAEGLSDRQAADAVRGRIDWKYALCLELDDPGFDASVLSEFRDRLSASGAEAVLFETLLKALKEPGLVTPRSRQRTDSTHVLAAIQVLNRLELVGETLRHALNTLAAVTPDWLQSWVPADGFARYSRRFEEYRLPDALAAIAASAEGDWLARVPAVETLRRVWVQQCYAEEPARWRLAEDLPPSAVVISSPYDPEARYCKKRETIWTGYKVHFTETCDDDMPSVVTDVDTTVATTVDHAVTAAVQARLAARGLTPREHLADTSYVTTGHLVTSQAEQIAPCSARSTRTTVGRRARARGSAPRSSRSTGSRSARSARRARPAGSGSRRTTALAATSSTSASTTPTVAPARSASAASPPTANARSLSVPGRCTRPCMTRASASTRRSSARGTTPALGSRERSPRVYLSATRGAPGILAWRRRGSRTCSSPPRSTSTAWRHGSPSAPARRHASPRSPDSPRRRDFPDAAGRTAQVRQQHLAFRRLHPPHRRVLRRGLPPRARAA